MTRTLSRAPWSRFASCCRFLCGRRIGFSGHSIRGYALRGGWDCARLPGRRRRKSVSPSAQRRRRVRSRASVPIQSAERVLATRPCTGQGRTAPRHTRCSGHLVLLGRVERRGPALGRVVQTGEVGARVRRDGRGSTSDCGVGLRGTGQRRRGRHIGVVGRLRNASTRPRTESDLRA